MRTIEKEDVRIIGKIMNVNMEFDVNLIIIRKQIGAIN
jgi:hypothetical protein